MVICSKHISVTHVRKLYKVAFKMSSSVLVCLRQNKHLYTHTHTHTHTYITVTYVHTDGQTLKSDSYLLLHIIKNGTELKENNRVHVFRLFVFLSLVWSCQNIL